MNTQTTLTSKFGATAEMELKPSERYLFKPFTGSSHSWALPLCKKSSPEARVLDVGPGSGAIGRELKEAGFNNLYAVEIDEHTRQELAGTYVQIEETLQPFAGQKFSLILLLDVLEHMSDPFRFYSVMADMLEPGGRILISVPNIAHWSIRFTLLFGFFEYTNRGLLDKTHLQFFTRKRFRQMLASRPDLKLVDINSSVEPAELVLPPTIWDNWAFQECTKLRVALARCLPGMFAYQHLAMLEKVAA
jgi:2-polyprenyl-3-methyl-5-hydroxy-6-metoxy-1,4-benzoquinol methylase